MRVSVVCAPGVGDLAILHIVSHHLQLAGHEVTTVSPHRFGRWLSHSHFGDLEASDAIFLQHDNSALSNTIRSQGTVYTFYGSHNLAKHGPLHPHFDFACDLNRTMVDNVVASLKFFFNIEASTDNGFRPPSELVHRRYAKRIAIHTTSGNPFRNWPAHKFQKFAKWAENEGLEPAFLSPFPSLEDLASFIYESGFFLGNDSGPGHLASCLRIPHLIIGREERHMRHWRPGWGYGAVITPPKCVPNWKGFRMREKYWHRFISHKSVINMFKDTVFNKLSSIVK